MRNVMDTASCITIKGILSLLMEKVEDTGIMKAHFSGMGDQLLILAEEVIVGTLQCLKFNGYASTVGLPQTRRHGRWLPANSRYAEQTWSSVELHLHRNERWRTASECKLLATKTAGIELARENALERYDVGGFAQVILKSRSDSGNGLSSFTYLRMNKKLFETDNWLHTVEFVRSMLEGGRNRLSESDTTGTDLHVGSIRRKNVDKTKDVALVYKYMHCNV